METEFKKNIQEITKEYDLKFDKNDTNEKHKTLKATVGDYDNKNYEVIINKGDKIILTYQRRYVLDKSGKPEHGTFSIDITIKK